VFGKSFQRLCLSFIAGKLAKISLTCFVAVSPDAEFLITGVSRSEELLFSLLLESSLDPEVELSSLIGFSSWLDLSEGVALSSLDECDFGLSEGFELLSEFSFEVPDLFLGSS